MTQLKRETELWYGEPLYYLASLLSFFSSSSFLVKPLQIVPQSSVDFHRPSVIYEAF